MESVTFDRLSRFVSSARSRRAVASPMLGAVVGLLGVAKGDAALRCKKGKKRCKNKCIPKGQCCRSPECRRKLAGSVCRRGRCVCPAGQVNCRGACVRHEKCCVPDGAALKAALGRGGPNVIRLCPDTTYENGPFQISRNVSIIGAGANSSVIEAGANPGVTVLSTVTAAELRGVAIRGGRGASNRGIYNGGTLSLFDCTITDNQVDNEGAGILNGRNSRLSLTRCLITGNRSSETGGGIYNLRGTVTLTDSTVSNHRVSSAGGGIMNQEGTLTLIDSTVVGNQAYLGGGIFSDQGTVILRGASRVLNNQATDGLGRGGGGGIVNSEGTLTLDGTSRVAGNSAGHGGGIYNSGAEAPATLTVRGASIVTDNDADPTMTETGGGIYNGGMARVEFLEDGQVTGNRPNDCTGPGCPA